MNNQEWIDDALNQIGCLYLSLAHSLFSSLSSQGLSEYFGNNKGWLWKPKHDAFIKNLSTFELYPFQIPSSVPWSK